MAATTWKVGGCDQEISINIECSNLKSKQNIVHSESVKLSDLVSNENLLQFRLVFDELQELRNMSTRPHVRNMSSIVSKLETILRSTESEINETSKMGKKWSDIVVERDVYGTETEVTSIQNIQTVITSQTSQVTNINRRRNGIKPSKIITAQTSKCEINYGNQDRRHKIIILGDSHTWGCVSEPSHNLNKLYKITGYVKPNTDLSMLIDTAKKEVSKLTKNDINSLGGR